MARFGLRVDPRLQKQEFFAIRSERSELAAYCLAANAELTGYREPVLALLKADCGGSVSGPGRRQILITRCGSGERINRSGLAGRFCCLRRVFLGGCRQRPEQRGSTQQTRSDPGPAGKGKLARDPHKRRCLWVAVKWTWGRQTG